MASLQSFKTIVPIGKKSWADRPLAKMAALSLVGLMACGGAAQSQSLPSLMNAIGPSVSSIVQPDWTLAQEAQKSFPLVELGAMDSNVGESKEDFLLRVGSVLHTFTGRTGHEACSAIMESESLPTVYRVRLITNRSQVSCLRVMFEEKGFKYTGETIHSHPYSEKYKDHFIHANLQDQRMIGFSCKRMLKIMDGDFSPGDLKNGGGYLVSRGRLLHRTNESEDTTVVGTVNPDLPLPVLAVGGLHLTNEHAVHAAQAVWSSANSTLLPRISCKAPEPTDDEVRKDGLAIK